MPSDSDQLSAVDVVELRVGLAGLTAEVGRMRADMAPLAGIPQQLQAQADLAAERLSNEIATRRREVADLRADVDELKAWQTWAFRLVIGAVCLSVLGLVLADVGAA
jgi:hypothetical protein